MKQLSYGVLLALCCCTTLWAQNGSKQVELKEVTDGKFRQVTAVGEMRSLPDGNYYTAMNPERTMIVKRGEGAAYSEDQGETWTDISPETVVSMNMWGFGKSFLKELEDRFAGFLTENLPVNPLKCEYFLPFVVTELLKEDKADVKVLKSEDKWYGVTYHEDKQSVVDALASMRKQGMYPEKVWEL